MPCPILAAWSALLMSIAQNLAYDHKKVTSWASAMEHVTFSFALVSSKMFARKTFAKSARIPALGNGTFPLFSSSSKAFLTVDYFVGSNQPQYSEL